MVLIFLHRHFPDGLLSHIPSFHLSIVNSSPCPGIAPQSLNSSFQLPAPVPCRGPASLSGVCMAVARIVCVILTPFRLSWICCFTLQQPQILPLCPKQLLRCGDLTPASVLPPARRRSSCAHSLIFFPSLLCPTEFCVVLYILFHWSGPPVHTQLVFCMHVCVSRCIPDVSMERDVLHIHLLLCHLVFPPVFAILNQKT